MKPIELEAELVRSGVRLETIVRLDVPATHKHVRYLDLMSTSGDDATLPDAVVESAGQPFAYVVRRDRLGDIAKREVPLQHLIRILACRSDARYLCVITPGAMDVYPIVLSRKLPQAVIDGASKEGPTWLDLLTGTVNQPIAPKRQLEKSDEQWLEVLLFSLLAQAARGIQTSSPALSVEQTLALVGRALFLRFLVDRKIVESTHLKDISPSADTIAEAFSSAKALIDTSNWLDKTFNGDLLSLGEEGARGLVKLCGDGIKDVCWHLTNIQHNSIGGQLELDWRGIMFRHVPVDVLSQVYEDFAHEFVPELARQTSVHFTPRNLAEILVDGVFSAVDSCAPHAAKVLDPSVGGGVFLVLSLRRLVAEHWKHFGQRPGRAQIRKILNTQLMGIDINQDALNVCALSLYLAALELDPKPSPVTDLKFDKLLGSVLLPADTDSLVQADDIGLGSLSNQIRQQHAGKFDIVVGNPPWTGWSGRTAEELERCIEELAEGQEKGEKSGSKLRARYGAPDIAFLLAGRGWAKSKGAIGFALHARLIFQPASMPLRRVVFETMRVTGVMNFSALRQDRWLWPSNDAQFILLTAQNVRPEKGQDFYFISPRRERALELKRQFRIDPASAIPVSLKAACTLPYVFKALYKGSSLGLELIRRIRDTSSSTIEQALEEFGLRFASGYQLGTPKNQTQETSNMLGLPEASLQMRFEVPASAAAFNFAKVQWPRSLKIYNGPLLLFRESPKLDRDERGAVFAPQSTVYKEHYLGISFHGKEEIAFLRDFLYILSYSDLVLYYQLLTSPKFGVERDSALQEDFENFPLVDLETLRAHQDRIGSVAVETRSGGKPWKALNELVSELYELSGADQQLIEDTLATELPFAETRHKSEAPASSEEVGQFIETFNGIVAHFGPSRAMDVKGIKDVPAPRARGWTFFAISEGVHGPPMAVDELLFGMLSDIADNYWVSTMRLKTAHGYVLHGRLNQARYWTRTEARLAAIDWIRRSDRRTG